ncbi:TPA: hypothetical protein SBX32_002006, partial [Campylobacter coli]|nr:hypothetical protein [Campylobacter coli]HEF9416629.1 hypothetical protein [Campylobacter coli]HEF9451077.1 hypothetical protein [Campylobacter coli]
MQKLIYQNHDYQQIQIQQTQKHFNLGCDFIVTSKGFKNVNVGGEYLT